MPNKDSENNSLNTKSAALARVIGGLSISPLTWVTWELYATKINGKKTNFSCPKFWLKGSQPPTKGMPGGAALEATKVGFIIPLSISTGKFSANKIGNDNLSPFISSLIASFAYVKFDKTPKSVPSAIFASHYSRLLTLMGTNEILSNLNPSKDSATILTNTVTAAIAAKPFNDLVVQAKSGKNFGQSTKTIINAGLKGFKSGLVPKTSSSALALFGAIQGDAILTEDLKQLM